VTKQFTAASILLLNQDGKLQLSDPIRKWLPQLPASAAAITIENLLDHSSGLLDCEN
jgi:CubicO group peptidase (beta-lactamase class C family)